MGGIGVLLRFANQPDTPAKRKRLHKALWKRIEKRLRDALISGLTRQILVHYISEQTYDWFDDPSDGVFDGVSFSFRDGGDDFPMKYASYHWTDRACVDPVVFADLQEIAKKLGAELEPRAWYPPKTIYFPLEGGDALASIYDDYLDVWTHAGLVRIDFDECPILDYVKKLVVEQRCLCEVCRKPTDTDPGPILDAETLAGIASDADVPDAPELFARLDEAIDDRDLDLPVDELATLSGVARRKAELLIAIGFEDNGEDMRLPEALVKLGARWAAPVLFRPAISKSTSSDVREQLRESMRALLVKPPVATTGELLDADGVPLLVFHFVGEYVGGADAKQMRADTDALLAAHPGAQGMVLDATELWYLSGPGLDGIVLKGRPRVWAVSDKSRGLHEFIKTERELSPTEWLFPSVQAAIATVRARVVDGYVLHAADETTVVETSRPEPGGRRIERDSEENGAPVALSQLVDLRGVLIEMLTTSKDGTKRRVQYPRLDARGNENEARRVGGQLTAWGDTFIKVDFNPLWREPPLPADWVERVAARPHLVRVSLDDTNLSTAEILQLLERCPHLEELYLHRLKLDAELFTSPLLANLKRLQLHGAETPPGAIAQLAALHPWLVIDPPAVFTSWSRVVDADGIPILVVSFAGEYTPDMAVSMKSVCTTGLTEHPEVQGIVLDATYLHYATGKEVSDLVPIGRPFVWAVSPLSRGLFQHIRSDKHFDPREWLFPSVEAAISEVRARVVGDYEIHGVNGPLWETWTREPRGRRKSGERTIDGEQLIDETLFDLRGRMIEDLYRRLDGTLTRLDEYPIRDAAGGENDACRFGARLIAIDGHLRTIDFSTDHSSREAPLPADWINRVAAHPTVDKVILDGTGVETPAILQLLERCPHIETLWLNTLTVDAALFASPLLSKLKLLYLWNASIPPGAATALAAKYPALDIQPKSVLEQSPADISVRSLPMTRTLTMILLPAEDPDELDAMSAGERREQCGARKKIELLHEGDPDVLVRMALDIDQGVYGAAKVAEETCTQETSAIFNTEVESAAELLKPHMADPIALAERFIEHAESGEDPARVARALSEELPDPARGPAEEAATWVRLFLAHVPLAVDLVMCIAWELRAPAPCQCAKWEGQTLGRYIKFPEAQFERLEGGGKYFGRMRCVQCSAIFGFEISADYAEVKREVVPLPEQSEFAKEVAAALGGELAFDIVTDPMQAIRIGQHCTVRVSLYGAFYRISLPLKHPWKVRSREDWTALQDTLKAALTGHRPILTMADVVASLPREWNVGYHGEAIENEALLHNATGNVDMKQNEESVTITVWKSGTPVSRELTSLDALAGLAEWIRGQVAEQASTQAAATAAIIQRLAEERASMRVPTFEEVMAALRHGHEIQVGGGRSFVSYAIKDGQLVQIQCDDGYTQDVACGEDRLRQAIAEDPNVFDAVVQRHQAPVN